MKIHDWEMGKPQTKQDITSEKPLVSLPKTGNQMPHKGKTDRDTKTKKPNFFSTKTKNSIKEIAKITRPKISTSPSLNGIDS